MRLTQASAILLAVTATGVGATPADDPKNCATTDTGLSAELAAWPQKTAFAAARNAAGLPQAKIDVGTAYTVALHQTAGITYLIQPEKPGGSVSYGGMVTLDVASAGTYVVALGGGAWIDVLQGGRPATSTAHGHGPACSTIRKMVDFPLTPGRYTIQLAASGKQSLDVMVARRP